MAIVHSVPSLKTWESLFQTLVKDFRLQETVLVFDNYSDDQEFFLKQQGRVNRVINGTVREYIGKMIKKCPKVKAINNTLTTQEIKLN